MGNDVFDKRDKYSLLLAASLRRTAVILAFFMIVYVIAAHLKIVEQSALFSTGGSITVATMMVLSALWIYFKRENGSASTVRLFLIPLHGLAVLAPVMLTGFMSPLTVFWAILITVTDILVSRRAMVLSSVLLALTAVFDLAVSNDISVTRIGSYVMYVIIIVTLAAYISGLQAVQSVEHQDFIKEKSVRATQQNQLMTLLNSVNEAIISVNAKGIVQLYNSAALNLLDTNQSLSGRKLDDVLSLYNEAGNPVAIMNVLRSGPPSLQQDELEHHYGDGEAINVDISSSRIRGATNQTEGYILVLRDITKNKSLEEERDEFISVVSHELRTPVTITEGTLSNVQMLIEKGASPGVVSRSIQNAYDQTLYLSRMINDLSTLSRAERGVGSEPELIDVTRLMHDLYSEYHPKAAAKKLALNLDLSSSLGHIMTSRLYLEEILQNLLTNAIKYTQKGSITLVASRTKNTVSFAVKDTGIGISKPEQRKVFDKFYRAEDYRTRETSGTGLGLYIVRKLARKLGVEIELDSRLNHGSTFGFALEAVAVDKAKVHE